VVVPTGIEPVFPT